MKSLYKIFILAGILAMPLGCNKDISSGEVLSPLAPTNVDASAGTWKPMYVANYTKYSASVPAPADTSTASYKAELASIKNLQSVLTKDQQNIINSWSGGGVLKWNQIFRDLVARYNLPPAPLANGSYIFPDANNPFADPQFPFANPPYAARAYSYVSVAMFDALKAAWYYKYQYNRPSPYLVDKKVKSLMPEVNIPSYPSEEAVMSGVAQTILVAMFPASYDEIILMAGQQRAAALLSGKASTSDITVGIALGKAVATDFIARAGSDGMGASVGTPAQWAALKDTATKHHQTPWISQDVPARPPMLPFFGNVRTWNMTSNWNNPNSNDMIAIRPPAPDISELPDQVKEVKFYSQNFSREREAIVLKWADGVGTYTPTGHWNDIAEEYIRDAKLSEVRAARAFALLNSAEHDAAVACWYTKFYYFNARPTQIDPSIKTGTGLPNFPSYVSGHSSFSWAAATVLTYLFPSGQSDFEGMANEAALSRLYGGIHYRIDCDAGSELGKNVGGYTITFAQGDGAN
ncbi:MAG TPA: PA-phosphatase [Cytophagales bacterium]|jgi:hypothetical protein|nr:PA-phosphatase [Cytophagales bacterium]